MSRAQKIFRNISFDSDTYDIYKPQFDSELDKDDHFEDDSDFFADQEANGKICDEHISELNPCNDISCQSNSSSLSQSLLKRRLKNGIRALSVGAKVKSVKSSNKSNKTELERCSQKKTDSENLLEDDLGEFINLKKKQRGNFDAQQRNLLVSIEPQQYKSSNMINKNNNVHNDVVDVMDTPQLSDISSFNPDDP